jgi:hypothetical protein
VLRWLSGAAEPRPGVWAALLAVAVQRVADLSAIIAELEQRANGSLSAAPPDAELFFHWCRRHHLPLDARDNSGTGVQQPRLMSR